MILIKKLSNSIFFWGALWIGWMGVIFFFSSMPGTPTSYAPTALVFIERKGAHIFEYAILALLSLQFFSLLYPRDSLWRILSLAFVWSFMYGASDEFHQFFVQNRGAMIRDVGIDVLGALLVLVPIGIILWKRQKKTR